MSFYHNENPSLHSWMKQGMREITATPNRPTWLSSCIMRLRLIMHDNLSHQLRLQKRGKSLTCRYEHMHDSRRQRKISSGAVLKE